MADAVTRQISTVSYGGWRQQADLCATKRRRSELNNETDTTAAGLVASNGFIYNLKDCDIPDGIRFDFHRAPLENSKTLDTPTRPTPLQSLRSIWSPSTSLRVGSLTAQNPRLASSSCNNATNKRVSAPAPMRYKAPTVRRHVPTPGQSALQATMDDAARVMALTDRKSRLVSKIALESETVEPRQLLPQNLKIAVSEPTTTPRQTMVSRSASVSKSTVPKSSMASKVKRKETKAGAAPPSVSSALPALSSHSTEHGSSLRTEVLPSADNAADESNTENLPVSIDHASVDSDAALIPAQPASINQSNGLLRLYADRQRAASLAEQLQREKLALSEAERLQEEQDSFRLQIAEDEAMQSEAFEQSRAQLDYSERAVTRSNYTDIQRVFRDAIHSGFRVRGMMNKLLIFHEQEEKRLAKSQLLSSAASEDKHPALTDSVQISFGSAITLRERHMREKLYWMLQKRDIVRSLNTLSLIGHTYRTLYRANTGSAEDDPGSAYSETRLRFDEYRRQTKLLVEDFRIAVEWHFNDAFGPDAAILDRSLWTRAVSWEKGSRSSKEFANTYHEIRRWGPDYPDDSVFKLANPKRLESLGGERYIEIWDKAESLWSETDRLHTQVISRSFGLLKRLDLSLLEAPSERNRESMLTLFRLQDSITFLNSTELNFLNVITKRTQQLPEIHCIQYSARFQAFKTSCNDLLLALYPIQRSVLASTQPKHSDSTHWQVGSTFHTRLQHLWQTIAGRASAADLEYFSYKRIRRRALAAFWNNELRELPETPKVIAARKKWQALLDSTSAVVDTSATRQSRRATHPSRRVPRKRGQDAAIQKRVLRPRRNIVDGQYQTDDDCVARSISLIRHLDQADTYDDALSLPREDSKQVTWSPLEDSEQVTWSPLGDSKQVTWSPLGDSKQVTWSPLEIRNRESEASSGFRGDGVHVVTSPIGAYEVVEPASGNNSQTDSPKGSMSQISDLPEDRNAKNTAGADIVQVSPLSSASRLLGRDIPKQPVTISGARRKLKVLRSRRSSASTLSGVTRRPSPRSENSRPSGRAGYHSTAALRTKSTSGFDDTAPSTQEDQAYDSDPASAEWITADESQSDQDGQSSNEASSSDKEQSGYRSDNEGSSSVDEEERIEPPVYRIPEEDMRRCLEGLKVGRDCDWSHTRYRGPNGRAPVVRYCTTREQVEEVTQIFSRERIVGFDMEWKIGGSSIKEEVSVMQVACDDTIAVFQLALHRGEAVDDLVGPNLRAMLESPNILKAGVNIGQDFKRIKRCLGISCKGCFELSHLHNCISTPLSERYSRRLVALARLVQQHLLLPLPKGEVRTSNWSKRLGFDQVKYAAADAYAGYRLFHELEAKRYLLFPTPERPPVVDIDPNPADPSSRRVMSKGKPKTSEDNADKAEFDGHDPEEPVVALPTDETGADAEDDGAIASGSSSNDFQAHPKKKPALQIDDDGLFSVGLYPDLTSKLQSMELSTSELVPMETQYFGAQAAEGSVLFSANVWVDAWLQERPSESRPKATRRKLQAYALWYREHQSVEIIAAMLKQPPLASNTVISYILDTIRDESLPFDKHRLQRLLPGLHQQWVQRRYWSVLKRLEQM